MPIASVPVKQPSWNHLNNHFIGYVVIDIFIGHQGDLQVSEMYIDYLNRQLSWNKGHHKNVKHGCGLTLDFNIHNVLTREMLQSCGPFY